MVFNWLNSSAAAPYRSTIIDAANANGVDPNVLANQIGAESSFNPNAVSSTGAVGIAQILPSTAANPGYGVQSVDPNDPYASINFAAQYTNARGGYNDAGLAAYSGGSYSANTTNNILGDTSGETGTSASTSGYDPSSYYNSDYATGGVSDTLYGWGADGAKDLGAVYQGYQSGGITGALSSLVGQETQNEGGSSSSSSSDNSITQALQQYFVRILLGVVAIVIIGAGLRLFGVPGIPSVKLKA